MTARNAVLVVALVGTGATPGAQAVDAVQARVHAERAPLIETMRELVAIESGSSDADGLRRIADVIGDRLRALGGSVERVPPSDIYQMGDTPDTIGEMVLARFRGNGTRRILLLAHMDTVYQPGCSPSSRSASTATGHTAWGLRTTSMASPSSCTCCRSCSSWTSTTTRRSPCSSTRMKR